MKNTDNPRRGFIKQNSLAVFGTMFMGSIFSSVDTQNNSGRFLNQPPDRKKIGDLSLEQLRDQYKAALFDQGPCICRSGEGSGQCRIPQKLKPL